MIVIKTFLISGALVLCHASTFKIKPSIQLKSLNSESSSTSPTISVQRFGGSTFYDYVKIAPTTTVESEALADEIENHTEVPSVYSASEAVTSVVSANTSENAEDDDESNEEAVVLGESEEDVETSETTFATTLSPTPPAAVQQDDGHTEVPGSAADSSGDSSSISGDNGGLPDAPGGDDGGVPSAPSASGDSSDGGSAGGVPSDQTPPPAEAVPGQPGEDDPDSSSSSSSEESSSSSSSEEFKGAYIKKAWEYKLKSKQQESLARIHNKFMKKDKISKYFY